MARCCQSLRPLLRIGTINIDPTLVLDPDIHRMPPETPETPRDPQSLTRDRETTATTRAETVEDRLRTNSRFRIGAFLLLVGPLLLLETTSRDLWPLLFILAGVGGVLFAFLIRRHRRLGRIHRRWELRAVLARESLARMERDWDGAPIPPLTPAPDDHPCAADLNILGRGSLAQLLGRVATGPGRALLRRSLLDPLAPAPGSPRELLGDPHPGQPPAGAPTKAALPAWHEELESRQSAVKALRDHPDLLTELELAGREVEGTVEEGRTRAFVDWATGNPEDVHLPRLILLARGLTLFNLVTLALWFTGYLLPIWIVGVAATFLLNSRVRENAHRQFSAAEGGEGDPARWSALLAQARALPNDDPTLARIAGSAGSPEPGASGALRHLRRISDLAAIRYSGLVHFPLAALSAWDIHILHRLDRWRMEYGEASAEWILAVAELELLTAMAGMAWENPQWAFPQFHRDAQVGMEGEDLGHPLLPPSNCVGNDVQVPPPGKLLLVTGSNMAGKTTLLRALGANQVLALLGAPVAAADLKTRPILPWTAMRVQDSINEGVSFFMAELRRLRRVVDAAREGPTLFLLYEILQGTNTAERRTAARIVLNHLLETGSIGAVTTHDLTLADAPDLRPRSVNIHFREDVLEDDEGRRRLNFDYQLRPGPATSKNALILLEMVGLGTPDSLEEASRT